MRAAEDGRRVRGEEVESARAVSGRRVVRSTPFRDLARVPLVARPPVQTMG